MRRIRWPRRSIVLSLLLLVFGTGCDPLVLVKTKRSKSSKSSSAKVAVTTQESGASRSTIAQPQTLTEEERELLNCETAIDTSIARDRVVQRQEVLIERHFQRVIRRSCDLNVISDKVETVQHPSIEFVLKAQKLHFWNSVDVREAYNRTTCDYGKYRDPITHLILTMVDIASFKLTSLFTNPREFKLTLNTSPVVFNTYVKRNRENFIDYEFSKCIKEEVINGQKVCLETKSQEKGTLILKVNYSERQLDGFTEIIDCPKGKNSTTNSTP